MKDNKILFHMTILLLLVVLASTSCTFEFVKPLPPIEVAFKSFHGRYVTAMGEDDNWVLRQEIALNKCGRFTQHHLANGKIALETCHGQYVTAPKSGNTRRDWMLGQEPKLGECGQFDLYDLGSDRVALKTCAGRFFTAGDGNWDPGLEWSVVGETYNMEAWEVFTVLQQYPAAPSVIADFDDCNGVTNRGGSMGPVFDPTSDDRLEASFVQEAGRGCVARLAYDMIGWSGFWIGLGDADLSPYSQLVFDIKVDSQEDAPKQTRVELKRAGLQEISSEEIPEITTDWQTMIVNLGEFGDSLSSLEDIEELVFVFEVSGNRKMGVISLDNIALRRGWGDP